MTRLSATATIAALLLLAIAQGFGATSTTKSTKSSPKVATKSTAKPYHITAQNQFHIQATKDAKGHVSKALTRIQTKEQEHKQMRAQMQSRGPRGSQNGLAAVGRNAVQHSAPGPHALVSRNVKVRKHQANPPTGKVGFVSATQIPDGGENYAQVQSGTLNGMTALITIVYDGTNCDYSEIAANGDGTFAAAVTTPTVSGSCSPTFVVGDLDGDGNTDIVEYDGGSTFNVLLSQGDGTFLPSAQGTFALTLPAGATGLTGGTGVLNATSGFIDLVVVDNNVPSDIVWYAGNGDGTFGDGSGTIASASFATFTPDPNFADEGAGFGVIIEDFDGDGTVDVAENDENTGQLVVYLSSASTPYQGTGTVTPDGNYDECSDTAGSLTGPSGLPAVIETNCNDNTITVYNNNGAGFSEGVYYPAAVAAGTTVYVYPEGATIADVNGDGNGDVVIVNDDSSDVTILMGNGDGTLQLASVGYATGGFPYDPAIVTDLNGDGLADILVADDNQSLVWMAGFGDGTFQASKNFYAPLPGNASYGYSNSQASGDFNGDGFADLVVTNYDSGNTAGLTVYLSNPDGSLQPGVNYGAGDIGYVTVGDFNGDGIWDIAASNYDGTVLTFRGIGNGSFIQGPSYSAGSELEGITNGAFNTSTGVAGFNDIAVVGYSSGVALLINDGSGGFSVSSPVSLTSGGCEIAAGTLNAPTDTNLDVAVAECGGSQVGVLLNDGTGVLTAAPDVSVGSYPYGIALADIDGDHIVDIATSSGSQNIAVALGTGSGAFGTAMLMPSSTVIATSPSFYNPYPTEIQITDVDGDQVPDLVYTNSDYSTVGVMFGTGSGSSTTPYFFDPVEFPTGQYAYGVSIADVNGDGAPDAGVAPDDFAGASVLINANGGGAAPNFSLSANPSTSVTWIPVGSGASKVS